MLHVLGIEDDVCDIYLYKGIMYLGGQKLDFFVYASMLGAEANYMGVSAMMKSPLI